MVDRIITSLAVNGLYINLYTVLGSGKTHLLLRKKSKNLRFRYGSINQWATIEKFHVSINSVTNITLNRRKLLSTLTFQSERRFFCFVEKTIKKNCWSQKHNKQQDAQLKYFHINSAIELILNGSNVLKKKLCVYKLFTHYTMESEF